MKALINKIFLSNASNWYVLFRVLVGLLFLLHGLQKLFGSFGGLAGDGVAVELVSLMGLAGVIETVGGLFILLGLLTRLVAIITALEMIIAYFMAHFPQGYVPLLNGGESALLFFAAFIVIILNGAKKLSLDKVLFKREVF